MKMKLAVLALAVSAIAPAHAQQAPTIRALTEPWPEIVKVEGVEILHVQKGIYMLAGAGANVALQVGDEGVTIVDSGGIGQADHIVAAIRHITKAPLRYLINTTSDVDHIAGNEGIVKAAGGNSGPVAGVNGRPANAGVMTITQENTLNRMMTGSPAFPALTGEALPESSFFTPRKDFYANGEPVVIYHAPKAHTDGDVMVLFRGSDVIATGDVFRTDTYPRIDPARGGSLQGVLAGLNNVLDITVPERNQMGGTRVIPGHGRICNEADVLEYRDMLTIIRDRVRDMVKKNMTLEQVKAAKPALEYDGLYGKQADWTGDMFLELVYKEQAAAAAASKPASGTAVRKR
jgi:glyoxylase-like metal-dependent hydrolase (beta-lactamase superfamily II)